MALAEKWSPASSNCAFQHYFYNHVGENNAPHYKPPPGEDEKKWEDALAKKPRPGFVPVLAVGYEQLGARLRRQVDYLNGCNARLHQIDDALTALLQKHDLVISVRMLAAKRKHQVLSQRCLALASRAQILRNRGFAMTGDEEELKAKLVTLDHAVSDPTLGGRSEEIWARMVGIRQRARILQEEMEKSVKEISNGNGQTEVLDETVLQKAAKVRINPKDHVVSYFADISSMYRFSTITLINWPIYERN